MNFYFMAGDGDNSGQLGNARCKASLCSVLFLFIDSPLSNLAATTVPIGNYDGDMDALVENGIYRVGENENLPTQVYYSQAIVCRGKNSDTVVQIVIDYDGATMMFRGASNTSGQWDWVDWQQVAIAAPPQEFDLPLAEGYTANGGCKYSKDQFGIVRVVGNINKSSGAFASNTPFATLPAGFRPGRYGGFVAIANSLPVEASKRHPAVVQVSVDGNITISMMSETDQTTFQQIIFAIQFLAAD